MTSFNRHPSIVAAVVATAALLGAATAALAYTDSNADLKELALARAAPSPGLPSAHWAPLSVRAQDGIKPAFAPPAASRRASTAPAVKPG